MVQMAESHPGLALQYPDSWRTDWSGWASLGFSPPFTENVRAVTSRLRIIGLHMVMHEREKARRQFEELLYARLYEDSSEPNEVTSRRPSAARSTLTTDDGSRSSCSCGQSPTCGCA